MGMVVQNHSAGIGRALDSRVKNCSYSMSVNVWMQLMKVVCLVALHSKTLQIPPLFVVMTRSGSLVDVRCIGCTESAYCARQ